MIFCRKCTFEVKTSMRHAIRKNFCPACGHALFGDFQMGKISLIKEKILAQEFSKDLSSDLIFDISLFIVSEFTSSSASKQAVDSEEAVETSDIEVETSGVEEDMETPPSQVKRALKAEEPRARVLDEIRNQVRSEVLTDFDSDESDESDDDLDLKVARLKRIAKENNMNKTGAMVRRVSD